MILKTRVRRGLCLVGVLLVAAVEGTAGAPLAGAQGNAWFGWVVNSKSGTVSVVDLETLTIATTLKVGKTPRGIEAEDVDVATVASSGSQRIDFIDNRGDPFLFPLPGSPEDVALVEPNVVATLPGSDELAVLSEDMSVKLLKVGKRPLGVAYSGRKVDLIAVANSGDNTVSLLPRSDLTSSRVRAAQVVAVGKNPRDVAFSPDGKTLAVSNFKSRTVSIVDVGAATTTDLKVGKGPWGVDIWSKRKDVVVVVANFRSNSATLIKNGTAVDIKVGKRPIGAAISPDGTLAVIANSKSSSVSVIDIKTATVIGTVKVGKKPHGVSIGQKTKLRGARSNSR